MFEASEMGQIYQNAEVNISADKGKDSRSGLFAEREPLDVIPLELTSVESQTTWKVTNDNMFDWMETAPSFSRAWVMRERQLARRILHFTATELVWECCGTQGSSFASETLPGGSPSQPLFNLDNKYQSGRLNEALAEGAEETYAVWNDICEKLSSKSVTKATDMPMILSSIAADFHRRLPGGEFIAGHWRSRLPEDLLWMTKGWAREIEDYIAPSWSWLSVGTGVDMPVRNKHQNTMAIADITNIEMGLQYERDSYGALASGALRVDGFLRKIQLDFRYPDTWQFDLSVYDDPDDSTDGTPDDATQEPRLIGPNWLSYEGTLCLLKLDRQLSASSSKVDLYFLFVTYGE
jgi:hypothetical protein